MRARKTFTKEFKLEAVKLLKEANKPASEIAMELGIRRNQLYKWRE
jgi:transposase